MTDSEKLDLLLSEMQSMKTDMQDMKANMQNMKADMQALAQRVTNIENKVTEIENKVTRIENKVTKIDLTIKNELRANIQRIAEGHLDLSRIIREVIRPSSEVEMLAIKVRMLESDMREVKAKLA